MNSDVTMRARQAVSRYFEMWNTGDSSMAAEILSPDWIDHAHPEVVGVQGVREAIERIRTAQPDLRFQIDAVLGEGDLVAAVGGVDGVAPGLIWLVRTHDGKLVEMWTYRDSGDRGRTGNPEPLEEDSASRPSP
ncbi:nuclear transport factor 2 family protein [Streptosporangium sp. NPDC020072]|uniref:ester cyclase n=1 Tax=Streptosporangium sp. NPDC020072 TaxID=3154788 RepID=UPI003439F0E1